MHLHALGPYDCFFCQLSDDRLKFITSQNEILGRPTTPVNKAYLCIYMPWQQMLRRREYVSRRVIIVGLLLLCIY